MKNTTMTKGITPLSTPARVRIDCSQSVHLLAPVMGEVRGMTLSADARSQAHAEALRGATALGFAAAYAPTASSVKGAPSVKDQITTPVNTTTTFMDVEHLRSGRPPV